jgi:hypothetical protein
LSLGTQTRLVLRCASRFGRKTDEAAKALAVVDSGHGVRISLYLLRKGIYQ